MTVTVSGVQILVAVHISMLLVPVTLMMPIRMARPRDNTSRQMMNGRVGTRTCRRSGNRLPHARCTRIKTCKTQSKHDMSVRWDGTAAGTGARSMRYYTLLERPCQAYVCYSMLPGTLAADATARSFMYLSLSHLNSLHRRPPHPSHFLLLLLLSQAVCCAELWPAEANSQSGQPLGWSRSELVGAR